MSRSMLVEAVVAGDCEGGMRPTRCRLSSPLLLTVEVERGRQYIVENRSFSFDVYFVGGEYTLSLVISHMYGCCSYPSGF